MDYSFENLGDERFQEFCSTLVCKEFPDAQSFPVGQPDGGRDSVAYLLNSKSKDFIIFQVKYVKNPYSINDVHKWLAKVIKEETPKIERLIPKGAKKFYLLTNVKGTAHLESGSIDTVNRILEMGLPIPSVCWWRDDLSRLLEKDPLFKWSFPEILNGQDILNSILFENIRENRDRREAIIKAYLADQYEMDNEVKFRQIDLQNKLLDLFTDVPIRVKKLNEKDRTLKRTLGIFGRYSVKHVFLEDSIYYEEVDNKGAASFLLHPKVQNDIERILLEAGPGQGKSTISQYICQVHRARLLNKSSDIKLIPSHIRQTPVRLPFKIDLRHIAMWVENKNPYKSRLSDEQFKQIWKNSLESFLIGHVLYHSQTDTFNSDDLIAVLKSSSVLFVFDGFDEIADLRTRKEVIDFINKGINRIKENSKSIQIVITSRPAAFSDTIGFSVDEYPHFELTDITPPITKDYVEKWIKACKIDSREAADIKRLVNEKLQLPHLKDLAKSPMQLAIFLSLLRTRGESLPNKRTALYDSYIELFFNRESEKNTLIRDHRDLIIDIHEYLAWILHSEAELLGSSGSIGIDDLKSRLKIYLEKEGHKTDITDQLFHVLKERVCALVSRVQGTYEFEVQPLREYFCAKYLYKTSPYSPPGKEKSGTKPERFGAIAKNFYWHNVVRFFAGCLDKGELPMLIQELNSLKQDPILKFTNYPSLITSQILSDWVFTQYPILLKEVVKIVVDGINLGRIIVPNNRFTTNEPILLPYECGRLEIFEECFEQIKKFPKKDYAYELLGIIRSNPLNTEDRWSKEAQNYSQEKLLKWLEYGYVLQILHKVDENLLARIVMSDLPSLQWKKMQLLINANRIDVVEKNAVIKIILLKGILENEVQMIPRRKIESCLQLLSMILHPYLYHNILKAENENIALISYLYHRYTKNSEFEGNSNLKIDDADPIDKTIMLMWKKLKPLLDTPINDWKSSISKWDAFIEIVKSYFGENFTIRAIAIIIAGIKSKDEKYEEYSNLGDKGKSLCKRIRCARMKSGNLKYWEDQINSSDDLPLVLSVFFTWATPKTLTTLFDKVSQRLLNLPENELLLIIRTIKKTSDASIFKSVQVLELVNYCKELKDGDLIKYIISLRFPQNEQLKFVYNHVTKLPDCLNDELMNLKFQYVLYSYLRETDDLNKLAEIKHYYAQIKDYEHNYFYYDGYYEGHYDIDFKEIPIDIAQDIVSQAKSYPRIIASIAEKSCRQYANRNIIAVGQIANERNWFG